MNPSTCPVCSTQDNEILKAVDQYNYYQCKECEVIFIATDILAKIDAGETLIEYRESYWREELYAAKERSWGSSLARIAELFLYARLPIKKCLDIGSGPGYILDAVNHQLPSAADIFYASELFPPSDEYCTSNKNYHRGSFLELNYKFDAGCCIEVVEHLTPGMFKKMMEDLSHVSKPNSIYIFNTGLADFIKNENIGYLDPHVRGHIMGWSIKSLRILLEPIGFLVSVIPGKTWAFIVEYMPDHQFAGAIDDRIWQALPENKMILNDRKTGSLMYILGLETARAYS